MKLLGKLLLTFINRAGQVLPKRLQRRIADFPGLLTFFEKLSNSELMEITTPEGYSLIINPLFHSNLINSGELHKYEPEIRKAILEFTKPGMVAYDIGANVGIFSFLFASIIGEEGVVYSFEPEENNYICFEKSLEFYGGKNIVLDKRAVSRIKSQESFDRRGGAFSGRLIGNGLYKTTSNIKIVETVSIDYLVKEEGYRIPDILKIDVEGNEFMVLEGMKNVLQNYSPVIICELHSHLGEKSDKTISLLSSYGYSISTVNEALTKNNSSKSVSNVAIEGHIIAVKK